MKKLRNSLFIVLVLMAYSLSLSAQQVGNVAPNFSLRGLDGNTYTLSDLKGKVVYIFLFGAECSFCRQSAPTTQSDIVNRFKNNNNFVALGIDTWNRSTASVINFRNQTRIEYPLLLQGASVLNDYAITYDRNIVINGDGTLVYKGNAAARTDINAVVASVENALGTITSVNEPFETLPNTTKLGQNYPNPFNPTTQIPFTVSETALVSISVYNLLGEKVADLTNEMYSAGSYLISWNGAFSNGQTASTGVYIYQMLVNGKRSEVRKMTLLR